MAAGLAVNRIAFGPNDVLQPESAAGVWPER
jgi:hypothetical protein